MAELEYRTLVWVTYRLATLLTLTLPLILLFWSSIKKEASIFRLLWTYWKVSSLLPISMLLLVDERAIGYLSLFFSSIVISASLWFWVDINDEIADLPPWRPLALTTRIWRWALTGMCLLQVSLNITSLNCIKAVEGSGCLAWQEAPLRFHLTLEKIFNFLFGANWTEPIAAFIGYIGLIFYIIGILQWCLIKFPKQGRFLGGF